MHIPSHFALSDQKEIFSFIEQNSFGQLISKVDGRLFSTHIPFILSEDKTRLLAHIGKQNPQHVEIENQEILITLTGPHDYISPSWYTSPGVPTWNYQAVHIYGKCRCFSDPERLKHTVDSLAQKYESRFAQPWEPNYKASMLGAIMGLNIQITDIQCQYKLSQNRSPQDIEQVIQQLSSSGSDKLALAMEKQNR